MILLNGSQMVIYQRMHDVVHGDLADLAYMCPTMNILTLFRQRPSRGSSDTTSLIQGTVNCIKHSVVDPNTLILDPDPGFWPNLVPYPDPGPDPDLGYKISFERTKITNKL